MPRDPQHLSGFGSTKCTWAQATNRATCAGPEPARLAIRAKVYPLD